jgi:hypothetical protein
MTVRYGFRSGWTKYRYLVHALCRLYSVFSKTIDAWAHDNLAPGDYTTFKQFTAMFSAICVIVDSIPDD